MLNRFKPSERFLAGCLLVALMVGIVFVKFWMVSVEERLDKNVADHRISVGTDKSQASALQGHERRIQETEHISWAVWDHHAPCDGWPTTQQIARGER